MPDRGAALVRLTCANAHARLAEDGVRAAGLASGRPMAAANIIAHAVGREQRRLQALPDNPTAIRTHDRRDHTKGADR